jgi:hypothetical protein
MFTKRNAVSDYDTNIVFNECQLNYFSSLRQSEESFVMLLPFLRDLQIKTFMTNEQNYAKCKTAIFLMSAIKLQDFVQLCFNTKF